MILNLIWKPFTAKSLREFWWYWNPGYGYFLLYYCYRPLRKQLAEKLAIFLTFLLSGLLHDALYVAVIWLRDGSIPLPFVSCWFAAISTGAMMADSAGIRFDKISKRATAVIHLVFLSTTFYLIVAIQRVL